MRAELNLFKLRDCRNIAGARRALEIYAAPTDTTSGLPTIGPGGQLTLPGAAAIPPTPYRYSALIERAKQLAQQAAQVEAALLSALEKRDAEAYQLLKARQDVRVARAGVRLQELRVREAESGIRLAELQRDRAQIQFDRYQSWIDEGESTYELEALFYMEEAFKNQHIAATLNFAAAATYGLLALEQAGAAAVFSSIPLQQQAAVSYGLGAIGSLAQGLSATSGGYSGLAAAASTRASILATRASYERHRQEWELARDLARQDIAIGDQQVRIAEDHVRVNEQERLIAELQTDNAERTVDFLAGKFTNVDLYDWMSDILAGVYRFLLQQATGMARLAAGQLAFERQEPAPPYIQDDYWEAPSDGATLEPGEGQGPDRRGLTGSARLLRDIVQLDQYAFETNRRKLQLTKVVSLAQFAPVEFQRFRESGVLNFSLPLELFDRDFPGHYLRLIRRVRLSMVALIPPTQGIKAAVTSTGISRVVVGGDVYQRIVLRREPESVALTSPLNASGIFELEPASPELNLPFEWSGVDMGWELRLPQAANLFDYRTIADVLMTLEYTALDSFDYRQQVQQALQSTLRAERPFSFRQELVDAWYDLHNPDQTAEPMTVRFTTTRDDFPPNLTNLRVQHLAFYIARAAEQEFELPITALRFTEGGTGGSVGGGGLTTDGLISTRRGNAGGWTAIQGKEPVGTWELVLPNTATVREHFAAGHITDLLLVITYSGRTPSWPA